MSEIHLLPQNERELFFRAAIDTKNMPFEVIEKDYWVVWVLKRLFSLFSLMRKICVNQTQITLNSLENTGKEA